MFEQSLNKKIGKSRNVEGEKEGDEHSLEG